MGGKQGRTPEWALARLMQGFAHPPNSRSIAPIGEWSRDGADLIGFSRGRPELSIGLNLDGYGGVGFATHPCHPPGRPCAESRLEWARDNTFAKSFARGPSNFGVDSFSCPYRYGVQRTLLTAAACSYAILRTREMPPVSECGSDRPCPGHLSGGTELLEN